MPQSQLCAGSVFRTVPGQMTSGLVSVQATAGSGAAWLQQQQAFLGASCRARNARTEELIWYFSRCFSVFQTANFFPLKMNLMPQFIKQKKEGVMGRILPHRNSSPQQCTCTQGSLSPPACPQPFSNPLCCLALILQKFRARFSGGCLAPVRLPAPPLLRLDGGARLRSLCKLRELSLLHFTLGAHLHVYYTLIVTACPPQV